MEKKRIKLSEFQKNLRDHREELQQQKYQNLPKKQIRPNSSQFKNIQEQDSEEKESGDKGKNEDVQKQQDSEKNENDNEKNSPKDFEIRDDRKLNGRRRKNELLEQVIELQGAINNKENPEEREIESAMNVFNKISSSMPKIKLPSSSTLISKSSLAIKKEKETVTVKKDCSSLGGAIAITKNFTDKNDYVVHPIRRQRKKCVRVKPYEFQNHKRGPKPLFEKSQAQDIQNQKNIFQKEQQALQEAKSKSALPISDDLECQIDNILCSNSTAQDQNFYENLKNQKRGKNKQTIGDSTISNEDIFQNLFPKVSKQNNNSNLNNKTSISSGDYFEHTPSGLNRINPIVVKTDQDGNMISNEFIKQPFVDKIQKIIQETQTLEASAFEAIEKIKKFVKSTRLTCQNIQRQVESKIDIVLRNFEGNAIELGNVYAIQAQQKMEELDEQYRVDMNYMHNMTQLLTKNINEINKTKQRKISVNFEIHFNAKKEQILVDDMINKQIQYENVISEMNGNVYAFYSKSQTDLVRILKSEETGGIYHMQHIQTFKREVEFITLDEERIICNDQVFSINDPKRVIQVLDFSNQILSSIQFNPGTIITGVDTSCKLLLWKWDGDQYQLVQKKAYYPGLNNYPICMIKNHPFIKNAILFTASNNKILQLEIQNEDFNQHKIKLIAKKMKCIMNFRLVTHDLLILLGDQQVSLINTNTTEIIQIVYRYESTSKTLVIPNFFNASVMPFVFIENQNSLQIADLSEMCEIEEIFDKLQEKNIQTSQGLNMQNINNSNVDSNLFSNSSSNNNTNDRNKRKSIDKYPKEKTCWERQKEEIQINKMRHKNGKIGYVEGLGSNRVLMQIEDSSVYGAVIVTQDIKGRLGIMTVDEV